MYCNGEHRSAHSETHEPLCDMVSKLGAKVKSEEQLLRSAYPYAWLRGDIFKNYQGSFWGILETREYMRARLALVFALGQVNTCASLQAQVDHLLDMLRLCRRDNMGVRDMLPAILLRLNKDQECYDFIKWWQTTGRQGYDYANIELPYLDTRNANVFESVDDLFCCAGGGRNNLSSLVAVTLLKIKLILDLEALQNSTLVGGKVPPEILDDIQRHVVRSSVVSLDRRLRERGDHAAYLKSLEVQVYNLYTAVHTSNAYLWPCLVNPGAHLFALPTASDSAGSVGEMQLVLQHSYNAWAETPGAIDTIKRLMAEDVDALVDVNCRARNSRNKVL